ncbi:MAG: hypothetical protein JST83_16430 [Bacteroidetes bacterium]|nr:hypothetical protein [Bacteroidota bacterium]
MMKTTFAIAVALVLLLSSCHPTPHQKLYDLWVCTGIAIQGQYYDSSTAPALAADIMSAVASRGMYDITGNRSNITGA